MKALRDKNISREYADCYQGLFDLMHNEHGVILLISEMDEIIKEAKKVTEKIDKL